MYQILSEIWFSKYLIQRQDETVNTAVLDLVKLHKWKLETIQSPNTSIRHVGMPVNKLHMIVFTLIQRSVNSTGYSH